MVKPVGIIVNPASGKDIRRLVASGTVITAQEKINIVVRAMLAMDALGVEEAVIMPDPSRIAHFVVDSCAAKLKNIQVRELQMPFVFGSWKDTLAAARLMVGKDCACVIALGGDGTSHIVSKSCGDVPLIPVSTGTNNVFPQMVEGTLVGMAAGLLATGRIDSEQVCFRAPVLEVIDENKSVLDHALVDVAIVDAVDLASRAVWDTRLIKELYLSIARPASIGLSAIGACIAPLERDAQEGLMLKLGRRGRKLLVPVAPGLMRHVGVMDHRRILPGEAVPVRFAPSVIALDGERERVIRTSDSVAIRYNPSGPRVVDISRTLDIAARNGLFIRDCR